MAEKIRLAVVGTGPAGREALVNQKFLDDIGKQYAVITCVAASKRTAGRPLGEVLYEKELALSANKFWNPRSHKDYPEGLLKMPIDGADPDVIAEKADYVISAVGSEVAKQLEPELAKRGVHVFSNASAFRWDSLVPLLIPEVNWEAIGMVEHQKTPGKLVCNPNCTTAGFVPLIHALEENGYKIEYVDLKTWQATSGKGDAIADKGYVEKINGNVIDDWTDENGYNAEEWKSSAEPQKILGRRRLKERVQTGLDFARQGQRTDILPIYTQTSRVPTQHNHLEGLTIRFSHNVDADKIMEDLLAYSIDKEVAALPTTPDNLFHVMARMPSPKYDININNGMSVVVGDIKQYTPDMVSLWTLTHNLRRGATWAGRQGLELYLSRYKDWKF